MCVAPGAFSAEHTSKQPAAIIVGCRYAASAVLSDGVIVTSFGNAEAQLESLRWRPPPRQQIEAYGSFAPIPIQVPQPVRIVPGFTSIQSHLQGNGMSCAQAPPPPGYPAPLPPLPLPRVPPDAIKRHATKPNWGYGPPCKASPSGEYNCMWATYQPIIWPWPPTAQYNHTARGFIEPPLVKQGKLLLSQSGLVVYYSVKQRLHNPMSAPLHGF